MTKQQVLDAMGTEPMEIGIGHDTINNPYRTEFYRANGQAIELLLYYTDQKAAGSIYNMKIADDDLTPLVLIDDSLDGWGWSYWDNIVQRYELRIR